VEVRADRVVAEDGEVPHDLLGGTVVPGHVVNHDDPATTGVRRRIREVRLDGVAGLPGELDGACGQVISMALISPLLLSSTDGGCR